MQYVPLRVHTKYSPLLSLVEPVALVDAALERERGAMAVVDRGVLFGWRRAASHAAASAEKGSLNVIRGAELAVLFPPPGRGALPRVYTLTLYAGTEEGAADLSALCRTVWREGRGEKLRGVATWKELAERSEGLIALSGGMTGPVSGAFVRGRAGEAIRAAARLASLFGPDRFYLEVSRSGAPGEGLVDPFLRKLERRHSLRRVAADPVRFLARGERPRLAALRSVLPPPGLFSPPEPLVHEGLMHLPSDREMRERYRDDPEPLERTAEVAERAFRVEGGGRIGQGGAGAGDDLIRICQAHIGSLYDGAAPDKVREIRNRFWSEYWSLETSGVLPVVLGLSRIFRRVRAADPDAELFTPFLSGSLTGYLAGLHETDPEEMGACAGALAGGKRGGRRRVKVLGDGRSIERFRTVLRRMCDAELRPLLEPVPLSKSDRTRLKRTMLSLRGERSGRNSNRSTRNPFEAHNRENHRPDPLPADEIEFLPEKGIATYREEESKWIWMKRPEDDWSEDGGFELEVRRSPMLDAVVATSDIPPAGDPYGVLISGKWTGLVPGDHLLSSRVVRRLAPRSPDDVAILLAAGAGGGERHALVERIASVRAGEKPPPIQGRSLESILEKTEGVPFFREQIVSIIAKLTAMEEMESVSFFRRLAAKGPRRGAAADRSLFLRRGMENGIAMPFLEKVFSVLLALAPSVVGGGEVYPYAGKMILLCARKKRDILRFTMQVLNADVGDRARIHQRIEGFQREGVRFLPVHRNRSDFRFRVEEGALRTGFASVPGFTEAMAERIVEERRRTGPFTTLPDFLQRLSALRFPRPVLLRLAGALEEAEVVRAGADRTAGKARGRTGAPAGGAGQRGGRRGKMKCAERGKTQIALPFEGAASQTGSG